MPTGETTAASTQAKLYHDVREPAKTVDMVPQLQHNSLISGGKFADKNYITVLTPTEVLTYDGKDTHISVTKGPIIKGWREKTTGLWCVPLQLIAPPRGLNSLLTSIPERTPSQTSMNYPQPRKVYNISTLVQVSQPRDIGSSPSRVATMPHGPISHLRR